MKRTRLIAVLLLLATLGCGPRREIGAAPRNEGYSLDLVQLWMEGRLRPVNRGVVGSIRDGGRTGLRVDERAGPGVMWLDGVEFGEGVIEVDVRGKEVFQNSFVGIAFHGVNDSTYDAVYVRPFNFRTVDPSRRSHAVQYISHPVYTWRKLRAERPGGYEQPINPPPNPEGWVRLRVEVQDGAVRVFINGAAHPSLVVAQLSSVGNGRVGLWMGDPSDGLFSNLRIIPDR